MGEQIQADHILIHRLLVSMFPGKTIHDPEEYEKIAKVFTKAGGSWESVFNGGEDMALLKRVIQVAVKNGHVSKPPTW